LAWSEIGELFLLVYPGVTKIFRLNTRLVISSLWISR